MSDTENIDTISENEEIDAPSDEELYLDDDPQTLNTVPFPSDGDDDDEDDDMDYERPAEEKEPTNENVVLSTGNEDDIKKDTDEEESEEDETDDEEVESDMLRKLDENIYGDTLLYYHPEIKQNNYNEILAMCKTVRDKDGIIIDPMHKTIPWLTKYERARVLGIRSKQLNHGADAFIEVPPGMISGYKIAVEELKAKKIPFIIRRPIPNGGNEFWKLEDLEILNSY